MKCELCQAKRATIHLNLMRGTERPFHTDLCNTCATLFGWKENETDFSEAFSRVSNDPSIPNPETLVKDSIEWDRLMVAVREARAQRDEPEPDFSALDTFDALDSSVRINGKIRAREIRVIGLLKEDLGIMPLARALEMARLRGTDLIEIGPAEVPPVCRLISLHLYRYELRKRARGDAA
jgi:hypothetical protein